MINASSVEEPRHFLIYHYITVHVYCPPCRLNTYTQTVEYITHKLCNILHNLCEYSEKHIHETNHICFAFSRHTQGEKKTRMRMFNKKQPSWLDNSRSEEASNDDHESRAVSRCSFITEEIDDRSFIEIEDGRSPHEIIQVNSRDKNLRGANEMIEITVKSCDC